MRKTVFIEEHEENLLNWNKAFVKICVKREKDDYQM